MKLWEDISQCLKSFGIERIFLLQNINTKLGSVEILGQVGKWDVVGINENEQ